MLEQWVLEMAASPGVFAALFVFATVDGIFPPIPSESVVIALSSLSTSTGSPVLWAVVVVAALGAFTGDQLAYQVGTRVPVRRLRLFRGRRGQRVLDWAEHALRERGAAFIIAARYIPVGRVAVNMTAGALGFRRRRFVLLTAIAAVTWALYSTLIGIGTGVVLGHSPLVGVATGVVGGFLIGLAVDQVLRRWLGIDTPAVPAASTGEDGEPSPSGDPAGHGGVRTDVAAHRSEDTAA
ncbi:VTT domain-containing protein [Cellulomonas sp. zg-ZUI199]|uniref:VTT domain-containing protein n=1 Tax=Cellulomonas wangleii TaxID=2816956 RepID=A0ABX8D1T6_9CELL|nr:MULTISPECIES: VTT domain-containing protein [Cellulomonas]MBO0899682.1 VTT domain-containing protein [Cellulomonas sp. zg-ZUI22]MBO0923038.1 VTT domain-containing protein [Cellulomonas wangleii]QVI61423.1 VTT domain-containing protein [Cellulomonas wangleii]